MSGIQFLSVCSGIEAASVAWEPLGWSACLLSEIEPFPRAVLQHRFDAWVADQPGTIAGGGPALWGDFTTLSAKTLDDLGIDLPDILCGGTPCQAFSVAGLRQSLDDARGNLSLDFIRLAHDLDDARHVRGLPGLISVWENVPGVLNTADNAFGCFLGGLVGGDDALLPSPRPPRGRGTDLWRWRPEQRIEVLEDGEPTGEVLTIAEAHIPCWPDAGLVAGPRAWAAWRVLDAQYFGLAQRRRRVFVVAGFRDRIDPAAVLFEPQGLSRNPPTRGEAGQRLAPTPGAGTGGGGGSGTDPDVGTGLIEVAPTLVNNGRAAGSATQQDAYNGALICFGSKDSGQDAEIDLSPTLRAGNHDGTWANADVPPAIAFSIMPENSGKDYKARLTEVAQPLMAGGPVGGNQGGDFVVHPILEAGARTGVSTTDVRAGSGIGDDGDPMFTLQAGKQHAVACAFPINQDALRGEGTAKTAQPDAAGQVRLRDPGLGIGEDGDPAGTLAAAGPGAVAISFALRGREGGAVPEVEGDGDTIGTLRAADGGSSRDYVGVLAAHSFTGGAGGRPEGAAAGHCQVAGTAVRRLTTRECARLQGFPDDHTEIPWKGRPASECPDGPQYKAYGNSWAVPCARWIGERIDAQLASSAAHGAAA